MKKFYLRFRKAVLYVLVLCMAVSFMQKNCFAQQNETVFIVVDLMKVKSGDEAKYVDLEQKIWKPIHQERINQGLIVGWYLYQVMYTGDDDSYNFATVNVYTDPSKLETSYEGIDYAKIHPGKDINKIMETTLNARTIVKEQLMRRVNYADPEDGGSAALTKYIIVNYMKSKAGGNYVMVENDIGKPTAIELIKNGDRTGWSLWSNVFPSGSGMESNFVTVDSYSDFTKIGSGNYYEAVQKALPGKKLSDLAEKIVNSRDMVRSELWRVIDAASAE